MARNYYCYAIKLNPRNVRALYGILLATANLKNSQKSKELNENSRLANWSQERLSERFEVISMKNSLKISSNNKIIFNLKGMQM
jgi:hypothetical protein